MPDTENPRKTRTRPPIALTIAGSDSGGGAGIQADLKTFSALGVYGASVITALTAQNTVAVDGVHEVPAEFIVQQLQSVLSDLDVRAIKIGMLSSPEIIAAVAATIETVPHIPVVLDPVMVAKSGDALLRPEALDALLEKLCPLAELITPNLPEAALLLDTKVADNDEQILQQANALREKGINSVLVKGGHLSGSTSNDLLVTPETTQRFDHVRIDTGNTHGTGCTLSSAIAAGLACGKSVTDAVAIAEQYVHNAILAADMLDIGKGHGPVHHFHAYWK